MSAIGPDDAASIEREIAAVEAATGTQVVAAIVPRADDYPEAPWRAFALGAALASLAVAWPGVGPSDWPAAGAVLAGVLAILACGTLAAIVARYVPACRRAFVGDARLAVEVRQCAEGLFLSRELFATPGRNAILILVAELERRVVVVPDVAYRGRVSHDEWQSVVERMTPRLRAGAAREAFSEGLAALHALLVAKGFAPGQGGNRLPDRFVQGDAP